MIVIGIVICVIVAFLALDSSAKAGAKMEVEKRYKACKNLGLSPLELDEFESLLEKHNVSSTSNKPRFDYYLSQFKLIKGIPSNQTISKVQALIDIAESGVTFLNKSYLQEKLTREGEFELLLFNSMIIWNELTDGRLEDFEEIKEKYFETLVNNGIYKYGINKEINYLGNLLNSRMYFFAEEMNKLRNDKNYTAMKLKSVFFENPLNMNIEVKEFNVLQLTQFYIEFAKMIVLLRDKTKQQITFQ